MTPFTSLMMGASEATSLPFFFFFQTAFGIIFINRVSQPVYPGDLVEDVFRRGDGRLDVIAGHHPQVVDGEDIGRVDHRHLQGILIEELDGKGSVTAGQLLGDHGRRQGVYIVLFQADAFDAQPLGQGGIQLVLADDTVFDQYLAEALGGLLLLLE
jgi:hypothetical protein